MPKENLQDYCDERAKKFLDYSHKDSYYWKSDHKDLKPTNTVYFNNYHYCGYCSRPALPIQAGLRKNLSSISLPSVDYRVTGRTCICEGAMNEYELNKEILLLDEELKKFKKGIESRKSKLTKQFRKDNPGGAKELLKRVLKSDKLKTIHDLMDLVDRKSL